MSGSSIIENVAGKVARVIAENRRLREECRRLSEQKERLRSESRRLEERVTELERKLTVRELAEGFSGDGGNRKEAKARGGRLMQKIDRRIALLNKE